MTRPFIPILVAATMTAVGVYWLFYLGVWSHAWKADKFFLTSLIFFLFAGAIGFMLAAAGAHERGAPSEVTEERLRTVSYVAATLPTVGFLGTVAGLINLMESSVGLTPENLSAVVAEGTSVALYPTAAGMIAFVVLGFMRFCLSESLRKGVR